MKRKQKDLIHYLYEHEEELTSETLSRVLLSSIRTIKSYIAESNLSYPGLILFNNRGYTTHKRKTSVLFQYKDDIPQDYEGCRICLIKKLLLEKQHQLDIFDLCDELFISYSTLRNDIYKMNTGFAHFQITFSCVDNKIDIRGTEKNKRKLIIYVMSGEASGNFLDLSSLQESFPVYDIEKACIPIERVLHKYRCYINGFLSINLIPHVTITISRTYSGNHIPGNREYRSTDGLKEKPIIDEPRMTLEQILDVTFTGSEKFEIHILFKTNANYHVQGQTEEFSKVVSEDILSLSHQLIQSIDRHSFVNFMSDSFLMSFALHLKNPKNRFEQHSIMKNLMLESIKISCPMIYDIATFMTYQLIQTFQQEISEDKIASLTLHVGMEIERRKKIETRISYVILCLEYLNIGKLLHNKILTDFGKQVNTQKLISFERAIEHEVFDLLVTTIPLPEFPEYPTVSFSSLLMNYDKNKITKAITWTENTKKSRVLADNIDFYFNEGLFYFKEKPTGKEETANELADQMISLGHVHADFKNEVWRRERASSTAFMNVAIPYPMKMSAYKTSATVVVCPKGMEWTNRHIADTVFMIAFNRIDNEHFYDLYESLTLLFNRQEAIVEIKKCRNFEDSKQIVIKNYIKYSWTGQ